MVAMVVETYTRYGHIVLTSAVKSVAKALVHLSASMTFKVALVSMIVRHHKQDQHRISMFLSDHSTDIRVFFDYSHNCIEI